MKREIFVDHNWLALKIHNDFFRKIAAELTGVVVDLGSGTQPYRLDIETSGCSYIAVDWAESLHKTRPDVVADLNVGVDLPDCCADSVISFSVLEHLHRPERMLAEAYRLIKPGGWLYMQVPFQWAVHEAPYDYLRFTRFGLEQRLRDAGFESISVSADCGFWVTLALKVNYHSLRLIRGPSAVRRLVKFLLSPFWTVGQLIALLADRIDFDEGETASYTVTARRPQ